MTARALPYAAALFAASILRAGAACPHPQAAQFDFWVGNWDVHETGKPDVVASSREEKAIGGCALIENYDEPEGYSGKSMNFFDPAAKKWRQLWVDTAGNTSEFAGEFRDGAMRFEGESHVAAGRRIFRRLTFTPLPDGSVRQLSEASPDGKTWKVNYDYTYTRKKT